MIKTYKDFGVRTLLFLLIFLGFLPGTLTVQGAGNIYYVSYDTGNDANTGLSSQQPLKTVTKVNGLYLQPGDSVLFHCGETWRADPLTIRNSGTSAAPITFGVYPENCTDLPELNGTQPVSGWTIYAANIVVANLNNGANAGKFAYGVNQLFRGDQRLLLGRWPNLDASDGGYASIDSQPSGTQFSDAALPAVNWTGAAAHVRGMRWYILNRLITADSGSTLTVGSNLDCWGGNCSGWGYFLNNHLSTLDQEGEWFFDNNSKQLYLYTTQGIPANGVIEASVILKNTDDAGRSWGGVNLGRDLNDPGIAYVVVEKLAVRRWFRHGIASPTNHAHYENHHLTIRNNQIEDVDGIGINLAAWVWGAQDGRPDGWRGGYALTISGNTILRANSMGINAFSRESLFEYNQISDIALIENLGAAGMGCSFSASGGSCTEDGDGIRIKVGEVVNDTGNHNTLYRNRIERTGYNGMDVFGHSNTFTQNVIIQACYSKGDCGGVRTFGRDSLASSQVYDLVFDQNIIQDISGNTDGCKTEYDALFGFGFYIDNYSRNVSITDNTVTDVTVHGILYQNSTGSVTGNTLYNNARTYPYIGGQAILGEAPAQWSNFSNNILFGLAPNARTLAVNDKALYINGDYNRFFHPYVTKHIFANGSGRTLAEWRSLSGKDVHSTETWYTQPSGEEPRSRILVNDQDEYVVFDLEDYQYLDLDQNVQLGTVSLAPFTSLILINDGFAPLTLTGITPAMIAAGQGDMLLNVYGYGFTEESVVRWEDNNRTTTFVSERHIQALIPGMDTEYIGAFDVTVFDPEPVPGGTLSAKRTILVVVEVFSVYLPLINH
ncbi:MAG: hypothetical protein CVU39_25880 [Chloroflexi bacterium HGW-Chloroflexi-10]|nr:MAG: hypothetical protein CVU39_25880 [Chloroflexi bacterium HGW-Chloroflexi-10]